jgi:hypothetical protein
MFRKPQATEYLLTLNKGEKQTRRLGRQCGSHAQPPGFISGSHGADGSAVLPSVLCVRLARP